VQSRSKLTILSALLLLLLGALFFQNTLFYYQASTLTKEKIVAANFESQLLKLISDLERFKKLSFLTPKMQKEYKNLHSEVENLKGTLRQEIRIMRRFNENVPHLFGLFDGSLKEAERVIKIEKLSYLSHDHVFKKLFAELYGQMIFVADGASLLYDSDVAAAKLSTLSAVTLPGLIHFTDSYFEDENRFHLQKIKDSNRVVNQLHYQQKFRKIRNELDSYIETLNRSELSATYHNIEVKFDLIENHLKRSVKKVSPTKLTELFKVLGELKVESLTLFNLNNKVLLEELERAKLFNMLKLYGTALITLLMILFIIIVHLMSTKSAKLSQVKAKAANKRQESLDRLKQQMASCGDVDEVSSIALDFFVKEYSAVEGLLYLYNGENRKLYLSATYAVSDASSVLDMGKGMIGEVARKHESVATHLGEKSIKMGSATVVPQTIMTFPLIDNNRLDAVIQLSLLEKDSRDFVKEANDFITVIISYLRDIQYEQKAQKYLQLIDKNVITATTNVEGEFIDVSEAFMAISGFTHKELLGQSYKTITHPSFPQNINDDIFQTIQSGKQWNGEFQAQTKEGEVFWTDLTVTPKIDKYKNLLGFSSIFHDITAQKEVERLALTDPMTMLDNRRSFDLTCKREFAISKENQTHLAFILIDIDHFKQYNDTYGHQDGDSTLISVANTLATTFSRDNDFTFRLGGEEFGVIFYAEDVESAIERANLLRMNVEELHIDHSGNSASSYVTISSGVFFIPHTQSIDMDVIYKRADDALYVAKETGRNKVELAQRG
jgi:diguanylate cyclase (GGDEF)-like protein/PAS domain S-box-containing protein